MNKKWSNLVGITLDIVYKKYCEIFSDGGDKSNIALILLNLIEIVVLITGLLNKEKKNMQL